MFNRNLRDSLVLKYLTVAGFTSLLSLFGAVVLYRLITSNGDPNTYYEDLQDMAFAYQIPLAATVSAIVYCASVLGVAMSPKDRHQNKVTVLGITAAALATITGMTIAATALYIDLHYETLHYGLMRDTYQPRILGTIFGLVLALFFANWAAVDKKSTTPKRNRLKMMGLSLAHIVVIAVIGFRLFLGH